MKHLYFRILFTMLISMMGAKTIAHDIEVVNADGKKIYYLWTNNNTELVVSFRGNNFDNWDDDRYTGNIVIPESVNYNGKTYSVTSIGDYAFRNCKYLISVSIPNSITRIEEGAFKNSSITSITIPYGVTFIGYDAFASCKSLTSVTIPNTVTKIHATAFEYCSSLTSLTIPSGVTYLGDNLFSHCSSLSSITIPESVTGIGQHLFEDCNSLTTIVVEDGNAVYNSREGCNAIIKTSNNELIAGCMNSFIPQGVKSIASKAFSNLDGLTSVTIPNSVTNIEKDAFYSCKNLSTIVVEDGNSVFDSREGCNAIIKTNENELILGCANSIIPQSVTSIGDAAFRGCSSLTSIEIPNSVTNIGKDAFFGCGALTSITLPDGLTSIGQNAFYYCNNLISVTIPNDVTSIGAAAFSNTAWYENQPDGLIYLGRVAYNYKGEMPSNTSIKIKDGTLYITGSAFSSCSGLVSVTIPNSVTSIGDMAFVDCNGLTSVTIPNSVTTIGQYAFSGCNGMTDVYCFAEAIPNIAAFAFDNTTQEHAVLHVPQSSIDAYKTNSRWGWFKQIVVLTEQELGVESLRKDDLDVEWYQLNGQKINSPKRGLNIIGTKNGKTRKVLIK